MATNIFKFDGSLLTTVPDGALDRTHATISFPGRGYQNYGEPVLENLLWVMENFAGGTSPLLPVVGQLWYDTSSGDGSGILKVYNGSDWTTTGGVVAADVPPSNFLTKGSFWYDTLRSQLNVWNGNNWDIVGPLGSNSDVNLDPTDPPVPDHSVLDAITVLSTDQQIHKLWRITVGGVLLAIISKDPAFTPQSTTFTNNSFQTIYPGLNFNNSIPGVGVSGDQTLFKNNQNNLPNFDAQWNLGSPSLRFKDYYGMKGIFTTGVGVNISPGTYALNINGKSFFKGTMTLGAGTSSSPPLKMTAGNSANPVQLGAIEFDGNDFYFTGLVNGKPTRQTPLFNLSPLESKSYFVSSTVGNDANNGLSRTQPFKTIKKALSVAVPGVSIFVESGEYYEQNPLFVPPRVSLVGDNLRRVIIRPVHDQLDIFYVNVNTYFFGFTFKDHRSPAFCFAFPCSTAIATVSPATTGDNVGTIVSIAPTYTLTSGDTGPNEDQFVTGYTDIPEIYIEAPSTGTAGQASAIITQLVNGGVADIIVTDGGSGYALDSVPDVYISGGSGTGASAKVRIKDGQIVAVDILNCGEGYTYPVIVALSTGHPGTGFTAKAVLGNGLISGTYINITASGSNYNKDRAPWVSIKPQNPAFISSSPYVQNCSSITGPFDADGRLIVVDNATLSLPYNAQTLIAAGYNPWVNPDNPTDANSYIGADPTGAGGGIRIDGEVLSPSTVIKSFVADSFTQINQGGIGHLIINKGYTQFVSCFTTFSSIGYWVRGGGFANISNSVIDFGDIGLKAEGFYPIAYTDGQVQKDYTSSVNSIQIVTAGEIGTYLIGGFTPTSPTFFYMDFAQGMAGNGLPARAKIIIDVNGQVNGITLEQVSYAAGTFSPGVRYTIETIGTTDFTLIGATANAIGTSFIATGAGTGNGTAYNVGGGNFTTLYVNSIDLVPNPSAPSLNPNNISVAGGNTVASGLIVLETPQVISLQTGIGLQNIKPQVGSALLFNGNFYTIVTVAGDPDTSIWDVEFTPPIISIDQGTLVYFHDISNISTGGLALEYVGSGVTYNALPSYGGVPDINMQVIDKTKDQESTPAAIRCNPGVVYYVTIDNTGNFKIGPFFAVNFIDGTIKFGGKVDLSNLVSIGPFRRNGYSVGTSANEISDDPALTHAIIAYDHTTIPTQYAVRTYIAERISTDVMPDFTNTRSIGTSVQRWKNIYSANVYASNATVTTLSAGTGNITTLNSTTAVLQNVTINGAITNNGNETKNGSLTINGQLTVNTTSGSTISLNAPTNITNDVTINGNLTVTGTNFIFNTDTYVVSDPIINIGTAPNNQPLPSNDGLDRGIMMHYFSGGDNHAFLGRRSANGSLVYITNISPGSVNTPNPVSIPPSGGSTWGSIEVGAATINGAASITGTLGVSGLATLSSGFTANSTSTINGDLNVSGDITAFFSASDVRYKTNVNPIQDALTKVNDIGGYTYDWNDDAKMNGVGGDRTESGVLAQEIEKVLPEAVITRENGYKSVQYDRLVPLLIQAIKELTDKVNYLENKNK